MAFFINQLEKMIHQEIRKVLCTVCSHNRLLNCTVLLIKLYCFVNEMFVKEIVF